MKTNVLDYLDDLLVRGLGAKVAVIGSARQATFNDLNSESDRLATYLLDQIETNRCPIAVLLEKSPEVIICDLAIVKAGCFYTNLDEKSPPERLKNLLRNIRPTVVLTSEKHVSQLVTAGFAAERIILLEDENLLATAPDKERLKKCQQQTIDTDPLCLINTSGSTGIPKSVILNHRSTLDFIEWTLEHFDFNQNDRIGSLSPFYFDIYTLELFVSLAVGSAIYLIPEQAAAFPAQLIENLAQHRITFIFWVPTIMVNIANLNLLGNAKLDALRRVFFAGEVLPTRHLNIWRHHLPKAEFVNLYGPIEITVDCTYFIVNRNLTDEEPIPIGVPCANSDVFLLTEGNELARSGEIGEICVRGSSLALGYFNNLEQTKKVFVQNPLNNSYPETIYRTGDLARWNDRGELLFEGRRDFQIKHQGYRIELAEIEHAILGAGLVLNACVLYAPQEKQIVLIYEAESMLEAGKLRAQLTKYLPKYMLPTKLIQVASMPMNPNGKIDRQLLSETHAL